MVGGQDRERQLAALFGESLIGPWPELSAERAPKRRLGRARSWLWWSLGVFGLVIAAGFGARALGRSGLERRAADDRGERAERLQMALEDGHLEVAARLLEAVGGERTDLDPADPHLELVLAAEAVAYRYLDAEPRRRARIEPLLLAATTAPRRLARLTILSRAERAEHLDDLQRLRTERPHDPQVHYLIATVRERAGDVALAREAYRRSEDLGPAWLAHRFDQLDFERRQGDTAAVVAIAEGMGSRDASAAWARLAAKLAGLPAPPGAAATAPPVQIFRARLLDAIGAGARGDAAAAGEHLAAAVSAVHGEAPFLLDAFDTLLDYRSPSLARRLTTTAQWPRGSAVAAAQQRRLEEVSAAP